MSAYATAKKTAIVLKPDCVEKIIKSKISARKREEIHKNAEVFRRNNLRLNK